MSDDEIMIEFKASPEQLATIKDWAANGADNQERLFAALVDDHDVPQASAAIVVTSEAISLSVLAYFSIAASVMGAELSRENYLKFCGDIYDDQSPRLAGVIKRVTDPDFKGTTQ